MAANDKGKQLVPIGTTDVVLRLRQMSFLDAYKAFVDAFKQSPPTAENMTVETMKDFQICAYRTLTWYCNAQNQFSSLEKSKMADVVADRNRMESERNEALHDAKVKRKYSALINKLEAPKLPPLSEILREIESIKEERTVETAEHPIPTTAPDNIEEYDDALH